MKKDGADASAVANVTTVTPQQKQKYLNEFASKGKGDLAAAVRTAVINKRAGGAGLISGREAFQRPMAEGVQLLNAIQDVYRDASITIA